MRITNEQLLQIGAAMRQVADERLVTYVMARFPAGTQSVPREKLLQYVISVRSRAQQFGIWQQSDIATALDLSVMYGADFYHAPWANDVFNVHDWDGAKKIAVIRERVRRQVPEF